VKTVTKVLLYSHANINDFQSMAFVLQYIKDLSQSFGIMICFGGWLEFYGTFGTKRPYHACGGYL